MIRSAIRSLRTRPRRRWLPTPSLLLAGGALFIVLGGSAVAATGLIKAGQIAPGAVTSKAIRNGAVEPTDLSPGTQALMRGGHGVNGANGPNGANGASGSEGPQGAKGATGSQGDQGPIGLEGPKGTPGTNGTNGTIAPLSATKGTTLMSAPNVLATAVELDVPAGKYVVMAKTQLFQTGAGDSVECFLKSGATILDQAAMKTLPALASVPASLQAVTTTATSPTTLSVQCKVSVATGSTDYSSLIAIPTA
jgi:Collagen triple helix repeat (20 copies)